ncbi:MAG: hypothetical protein EOS70_17630 [Mesorhizobium sp.]|uniref:hypothetical protein n=1 Tax=Mesorhizobium sp. TaxID=1871066 RepID=UPI000FE4FC2B|nr:hypothetical protein [Mesorhizobium sp.]RWC32517.1 MAG: hypothetical protein EOS70_17630 [Mesorhizobium sp.]
MSKVLKSNLYLTAACAVFVNSAYAQDAAICSAELARLQEAANTAIVEPQAQMQRLVSDMQAEMDKVREENPIPNYSDEEVMINFTVDVEWKRKDIILDIPQVTMKLQEWKFDVPQVTTRLQEIIFHTPSTRMVLKKTGEYPEFYCSGFKCTVRWSPILTKVPEVFMQEQRIKMDIPEFKIETTSIKLHIPEIKNGPQKFSLDIPEFTVREPRAEIKQAGAALTQRADEIKSKYEPQIKQIETAMQDAVTQATNTFTGELVECQMKANAAAFGEGAKSFDAAVEKAEEASVKLDKPEMQSLREQMSTQVEQIQNQFEQEKNRFEAEVLNPVVQKVVEAE